MNVTCPACSSRYAIPDDKVAGRRARLKCKRCGELIPVDGRHLTSKSAAAASGTASTATPGSTNASPSPPPPPKLPPPKSPHTTDAVPPVSASPAGRPAPPPSAAATAAPQWTLAQPSGAKSQVSTATLVELYRGDGVEPGALLWREGMDRWLPPYDVPEVTDALQREGLRVPGSDLGASFDDEEEATRVALSPLMPSQPRAAAPSSPHAAQEDPFGDDEVTRAFEPSPLAGHPTPRVPPTVVDDDEVTRAFEAPIPLVASAPNASAQDDDEATRVFESPRLGDAQAQAQAQIQGASRRLDPSFLGSATPPPDEAPRPFEARSILSVPPQEETSDVSGLADSVPVQQRTSISWRPSAPTKKRGRFLWLMVPTLLAAAAVLVQWQRPEWGERARHEVLTLLGRAPVRPVEEQLPPFDTERVGSVLEEAALAAPRCKLPDGPTGHGRVHVRYANSGRTDSAEVSDPFAGTEVGECLTALFAATRVPPFSGRPVIVAKNFTVE